MMNKTIQFDWKEELRNIVGKDNIILKEEDIKPYATGIRVGMGKAQAVVNPNNLIEMWKILEVAVRNNIIIIM